MKNKDYSAFLNRVPQKKSEIQGRLLIHKYCLLASAFCPGYTYTVRPIKFTSSSIFNFLHMHIAHNRCVSCALTFTGLSKIIT